MRKIFSFLIALVLVFFGATRSYGLELSVSGNGSDSSNTINLDSGQTTQIEQTNTAEVTNDVTTASDTGGNETNANTGGDVSTSTGDTTQDLSLTNSLNTSLVSADCCDSSGSIVIEANGSDSTNTVNFTSNNQTNITTSNVANVANTVNGSANTGGNTANNNTSGDVEIDTGDIEIYQEVINGPINVASVTGGVGGGDYSVRIAGNGSASSNFVNINTANQIDILEAFLANIINNFSWDLNTGNNVADGNTGGDVRISTGNIFVDLFLKNGPINVGGVVLACCDPSDPGDPGDPGDLGSNGGGSSTAVAAANSSPGTGGSVLGLSDTSGQFSPVVFWIGILALSSGGLIITKELKQAYEQTS